MLSSASAWVNRFVRSDSGGLPRNQLPAAVPQNVHAGVPDLDVAAIRFLAANGGNANDRCDGPHDMNLLLAWNDARVFCFAALDAVQECVLVLDPPSRAN